MPGPPGPPGLLPQRGPRPGPTGQQHRVEPAHVDAQLEGVRRGQADDVSVAQGPLELAALLGEVTAPVCRDGRCEPRLGLQPAPGAGGQGLDPGPRPGEGHGLHAGGHQLGQQVGGLGGGTAPGGGLPGGVRQLLSREGLSDELVIRAGGKLVRGELVRGVRRSPVAACRCRPAEPFVEGSRLPQGEGHRLARRTVDGHRLHGQPDQAAGVVTRVAHGGGREDEGGRGAIPGTDPSESPQERREVRAEDAAVDVALVDDDVAQPPQERRPALVQREQRVVHEVGVGEHEVGVVADPAALLAGGVAVVGRGPDAGHGHGLDAGELVCGERLGRGEVERGGSPPGRRGRTLHERGQHGQEVAQALARGGPGGHDDVRAGVGQVGCLALVRPQGRDPGAGARRIHGGVHPVGPGGEGGRPRWHLVHVAQALGSRTGRQGCQRCLGVEAGPCQGCGARRCGHCRYRNPEGRRPSRPPASEAVEKSTKG